jgi:regulator of protease activity HflC (stomatin/prohibitin superfamily)
MKNIVSVPGTFPPASIVAFLLLALAVIAGWRGIVEAAPPLDALAVLLAIAALLIPRAVMVARQWERAVVLRLGKLHAIRGPGLFVIVPFFDAVAAWIDQRIQTTQINAERALTRDTVPVDVDAIVFWQVHNAERAALEIAQYRQAIEQVAQTSLREMIGASPLSSLLSDRRQADDLLKNEIGRKTAEWGIAVISVEIRDVAIPPGLQDAMSREAQAEREKQARVILGSSEAEIAHRFVAAAEIYASNPAALQLRAMNIIYETTKERGATILVPTSMIDSLNPGGVLGLAAAVPAKATAEAA